MRDPLFAEPTDSPSPSERGSSFLITLLVLFVLTALGLSLVMVTQTAVLVGSQERVIEKTFYAAESGLEVSIARALAEGDFTAATHVRIKSDLEAGTPTDVRERVESSTFFCLGEAPCDLCSVNQGRAYMRRNHLLAARATRYAPGPGGSEVQLGRKFLSTMVDVEPFQSTLHCLAEPEAKSGFRYDEF